MIVQFFRQLFGSRNQRLLKQLEHKVIAINALETKVSVLSDQALQNKTIEFKQRLSQGEKLDALLPEAFAVVREAGRRVLNMRHFDVQLIGGMVLHQGKIAEMRTGEGKTLVGTLPAYLNALTGRGVHIVTVNDYLAKRDAAWMGKLYEFLGLTVGVILAGQSSEEKRAAYACDIVYGTNNEYGFDYLRDNMAFTLNEKVQRELHYAIVDEVDSILIDEARTPLIISGASADSSELYRKINTLVPKLIPQTKEAEGEGDYYVEEKHRQVHLTERGHEHIETLLAEAGLLQSGSLYELANITLMHHVNAALRAQACFQNNVDYIVKNGEVIIVDEHTGRTMPGRRWSDGLHQAIEAKEGVHIQQENVTLAGITFQNFFRLYEKLSGMTGTADTEAYEFHQIYRLEVVVIPTNKPMLRRDLTDQIYLTMPEKFAAVIKEIKQERAKNRPILVGTASIEASEYLSTLLKAEKISHQVLNAKYHEKEASIIAEAGRPGAVTIATNMAGRGTDIVLGGNLDAEIADLNNPTPDEINELRADWQTRHDQVVAAGGLHIIGSERHESRRIDNQLRGRSGRQGDPGSSRFYLSLQDNLMRIFASERLGGLMQRLGMKEGESIEHPWVSKAIENAQRKVEGHNFDIRKQLLEYDDVANDQRKVIYSQRAELMAMEDISPTIQQMRDEVVESLFNRYILPNSLPEQWDVAGLDRQLKEDFNIDLALPVWLEADAMRDETQLRRYIFNEITKQTQAKENAVGAAVMRSFEKSVLLQSLDQHWREHLSAMDHLRQGIHLRGYAQKNPKQEYKREAFNMFTHMLDAIKHEVVSTLSRLNILSSEEAAKLEEQRRRESEMKLQYHHAPVMTVDDSSMPEPASEQKKSTQPFVRAEMKVGRNNLCPCNSGKKYKHCHGSL